MLIKDVPDILELLKKVLKEIENKECDETIFQTMNGELIILIDKSPFGLLLSFLHFVSFI